jgi:hypothetical protein
MAATSAMDEKFRALLESDVRMTQERFCVAMNARLPTLEADTLERYFAALSKLVEKLEDSGKSWGDVVSEMISEAASLVMQEMQRAR